MITPLMLKTRPYAGEEDLQPICDLANLCNDVDKIDDSASPDGMRIWIERPERDKARDTRIWEDAEGRLLIFAQVLMPKGGEQLDGFFYFRVHPEIRNRGLETEVIEWGTERLREVASERSLPAVLRPGTVEHDTYGRGILEAQGFEIDRYFFLMKRALDQPIPEPQFPEGFTMRHTEAGNEGEIEHWVEMFNLSFIDHWGFHPTDVEQRKHRLSWLHYRPELDLIALAPDGTFAAFCYCQIDPEDNARTNRKEGWIGVLGTRRGFRKIGLGRAMLLTGLHKLKQQSMDTAVLGVDAENPTGALGLYESAGFYKADTEVSYNKKV